MTRRRGGFSWPPFEGGRTVPRGGAGIFSGYTIYSVANVTKTLSGLPGDPSIHLMRKRDVNQFKSSLVVAGTDEPCLFRLGAVPTTCTGTATGPDFVNPLRLRDNVYESWANSF